MSRYQKGGTNLDFTEARDSEWQWYQLGQMQVCTLLQTDNHTSIPPLSFLQAGCPSCRPTNSVKALKAQALKALRSSSLQCKSNATMQSSFLINRLCFCIVVNTGSDKTSKCATNTFKNSPVPSKPSASIQQVTVNPVTQRHRLFHQPNCSPWTYNFTWQLWIRLRTWFSSSCTVLFCSLAVLDPRVGHIMDVIYP